MKRDLVTIQRAIAAAKDLVDEELASEILAARVNARYLLNQHGLVMAGFATQRDPGLQSFVEFNRMVSNMRAGGFHCVRERGGRGIPTTKKTPADGSTGTSA